MGNLWPMQFVITCNNVTCFQKQPPLFLEVAQILEENNCVGVPF